MKTALQLLSVFLLGAAAAAALMILSGPPRTEAVSLLPAQTPAPLLVHVTGAVARPSVVSLPPGSRVQDAIQAAGGLAGDAEANALNLSGKVKDGERLHVPAVGEVAAAPAVEPVSGDRQPANLALDQEGPVNLNTASAEQLMMLPGIGEVKAAAIIAYREAHDGFKTIEEIMEVSGFGEATFERLKDSITVD